MKKVLFGLTLAAVFVTAIVFAEYHRTPPVKESLYEKSASRVIGAKADTVLDWSFKQLARYTVHGIKTRNFDFELLLCKEIESRMVYMPSIDELHLILNVDNIEITRVYKIIESDGRVLITKNQEGHYSYFIVLEDKEGNEFLTEEIDMGNDANSRPFIRYSKEVLDCEFNAE